MKKIRNILKSILPKSAWQNIRSFKRTINLWLASASDRKRYATHSILKKGPETQGQWRGALTFDYHKIEKGLALPNPRSGFGKDIIDKLLQTLPQYEEHFGTDDMSEIIVSVLREYEETSAGSSRDFEALKNFLHQRMDKITEAGTTALSREDLFPIAQEDAVRFLLGRHSVRQYESRPVDAMLIEKAMKIAQRAPSVCNRQAGHVFVSTNTESMRRLLSHQNGNRGFGDTLGGVAVITSDLAVFQSVGERNQPFVDGGIFAMGFLTGLHAVGLGACMLNWSADIAQDRKLREEFGFPENHVIITMIGFGHVPEHISVAASPRDAMEKKLHWVA